MLILPGHTQSAVQQEQARAMLFPNVTVPLPEKIWSDLFVAVESEAGDVQGAILGERLPGATASLCGPCVLPGSERISIEDELLDQCFAHLRDSKTKVVQAFRALGADNAALLRNGMPKISTVWTMRHACRPVTPHQSIAGLRFESQRDGLQSSCVDALIGSFEGSCDCPELNGLRTPEEVLAGHQGGAPDLALWWLLTLNSECVGVLILVEESSGESVELSYVGVLSAFRGRAIGKAAVQHAMQYTAKQGKELTLLVDQRNRIAIEVYKKFGFAIVDARDVYLRSLQLT